ncbi:hypothetical protein ACHAPU_006097 [Fusarium lateritium]
MPPQSTTLLSIDSLLNPEPASHQPKPTTTYWPILRDALLKDPSLYDNLHLECGICLDEMTVFPHEHSYDPDMFHLSHRARIFPCGHIFGSKCAHFMIEETFVSDRPICCPICRIDFSWHRDCKHVHTGMPMPTSIEAIRKFPMTLSEGAAIADKCGDCQVTEILIGINYLAPTLLFPFEIKDDEVLCVTATTHSASWGIAPSGPGSLDGSVEYIHIGESLQKVCDEAKTKLADSATKSWLSLDLTGFELSIQLRRMGMDE